jgi:hypothetical protein
VEEGDEEGTPMMMLRRIKKKRGVMMMLSRIKKKRGLMMMMMMMMSGLERSETYQCRTRRNHSRRRAHELPPL